MIFTSASTFVGPGVLLLLAVLCLLSVAVGCLPAPQFGQRGEALLHLLGRLSVCTWRNAPGSLKLPLSRMPAWTDRGRLRAALPEVRPRTPRPPARPGSMAGGLLALLLLAPACVSPLDLARKDFTTALQVAQSAHVRLKAYDARHQLDLVRKAGGDRDKAFAALAAYRVKRKLVTEQDARTEAVMDATADVLLLSEAPVGIRAAADAKASAMALRDAVAKLMMEGQ